MNNMNAFYTGHQSERVLYSAHRVGVKKNLCLEKDKNGSYSRADEEGQLEGAVLQEKNMKASWDGVKSPW